MSESVLREKNLALLDLLDRILDKGVILRGDITISVADVDLVYLGLKVLLSSVDTVERIRGIANQALLEAAAKG
ncbi:MAG: gas vesicle protein GvpJ [Armatimonadota bacterium]|nr:gas vesicle protein GvpJ [Armatimonadota bacterium]